MTRTKERYYGRTSRHARNDRTGINRCRKNGRNCIQTKPHFAKQRGIQHPFKGIAGDNLGENSSVMAPISGAAFDHIKIGNNVFINSNILLMARGGITIEDDVMIAGNVQLLSNNHDEYDRQILICKPILIKKGAWIGAGVSILPGVTVGKYAIVGAGAIVTKDVPDYGVAVGTPARIVNTLDKNQCRQVKIFS